MEVGKAITGFDGYEVSNLRNIKSLTRQVRHNFGGLKTVNGRILKPIKKNNGYLSVWMNGKTKSIHRLVAIEFLDNSNNLPLVQHKDDDKTNNEVTNLCWGTAKSNMDDCVSKGRWNNQYTI